MGDYRLQLSSTLIVGMSSSGKSTFAYRYLVNSPAACRFVFDDMGRAATRLNMRPCYTANELEAALSSRWVIFNPGRMFPDDFPAAFQFFCKWVYDVSRRGPGKKFFLVDEVWQWQNNYAIPRELALIVQAGREENIEFVSATQVPNKINSTLIGQTTELVCFRVDEKNALNVVEDLGMNRDEVQNLPLGSFISINRLSRSSLAGKLF